MESEKECSLQRAELRRHLAAGHIPESWTQLPLRHLSLIGGLSGSMPASLARLSATLEHLEVTQPAPDFYQCSIGPQNLTGVWVWRAQQDALRRAYKWGPPVVRERV